MLNHVKADKDILLVRFLHDEQAGEGRKEKTPGPHRPIRLFDDCEYAGNIFGINIDRKKFDDNG